MSGPRFLTLHGVKYVRAIEVEEDDEEDFWLEQKHYGASAAGCIVKAKKTGKYLLLFRSTQVRDPSMWGIPGGRVLSGKTPAYTAKRETLEEAGEVAGKGLKVEAKPFDTYDPGDGSGFKFYTFLGTVPDEFEPELNWESAGYAWVTPAQVIKGKIKGKPIHPNVIAVFKKLHK